jgi:hypothetical protein
LNNKYYPETPRLKRIKRALNLQCASHKPSRAPILLYHALPSLFPAPTLPLAQICFLLAARVGNLDGCRIKKLSKCKRTVSLSYAWFRHKTVLVKGEATNKILFCEMKFQAATKLLEERTTQSSIITKDEKMQLQKEMKTKNIRMHSLRRSGLGFWRSEGKSMQELMLISLHSNVMTLNQYLDNEGSEEDD